GHPCPVHPVGLRGEDLLVGQDRAQSVDDLVDPLDLDGHDAPPFVVPPTSMPRDVASSSWMSTTSICWASPAWVSGRSDQGQALTRVSTSRAAAFSIRLAEIRSVSSGFSIGRPPPPPEQYDHWVTRSTSLKVRPGIARRISR